ncbi:uncharacterized protein TNCV_3614111 [Trichonephila clavipes]|uniref:Uncharacterized protein n=1 Tax=Trichonephila clavipes TaxID=2585209 RepID=A0A8X6SI26_TRICX|nr:uncharacterized protein TNCV_3614111 [Trichonephila clavipes]
MGLHVQSEKPSLLCFRINNGVFLFGNMFLFPFLRARWPKVKVLVAALENPATPDVNHCSASERLKERHLKDQVQDHSSEEEDTYPDPPKIRLERRGSSESRASYSNYKYEAKTRHRVSLVLAHVTTLEEDLKQLPLCQDSLKDVLSDSGLEIELAIPFVPNRDPPDTPQQSELGEVVHYHPSE